MDLPWCAPTGLGEPLRPRCIGQQTMLGRTRNFFTASTPGGGSCGLISSPGAGQRGGPHPRTRHGRGCNPASGSLTGWAVCRRACWWMSAEHRTGKGEEVLASNLSQGCEGEHSIPSAAAAGVRRGNVPRQPRGYTVGKLAEAP